MIPSGEEMEDMNETARRHSVPQASLSVGKPQIPGNKFQTNTHELRSQCTGEYVVSRARRPVVPGIFRGNCLGSWHFRALLALTLAVVLLLRGATVSATAPAGTAVSVLDEGSRFPVTVLDDLLEPVPGATVYLVNNATGLTVQMGVTNPAGLVVMVAPEVAGETWFRVQSTAGSLVSPWRVIVLPGENPAAAALRAEVALTNDNTGDGGAAGPAYIGGRVVRLFDAVTGETAGITDGIGAFDAYLTYDGSGMGMKAASGVGPFAANTTVLLDAAGGTRSNVNAFQAGAAPNPPVELFRLYPWITGSHQNSYKVTLHFKVISRVTGQEVAQAWEVSKTFRRGDADGNGEVTITDALFIAQYLAGLRALGEGVNQVNAVNAATPRNDSAIAGSSITIQDALYIAQMLAGLRDASYNMQ